MQVTKNKPGSWLGEGGRRKGRTPLALSVAFGFAFLFPLLALFGCGLETVTYYSPPYFAYSGNIITLSHNSSNSSGAFLGYDIYYRAYYSAAEADSARTTVEGATSATNATPESVLSQMTNTLGFKKIYLASKFTVPPTPLLAGAALYTIQMPNDSSVINWYFTTDIDSTTKTQIVRGTGSGESFNYKYVIGASDYASLNTAVTAGQPVFIVAFAVAYGYDFTTLSAIYSFPASLYQEIGGLNGWTLPN